MPSTYHVFSHREWSSPPISLRKDLSPTLRALGLSTEQFEPEVLQSFGRARMVVAGSLVGVGAKLGDGCTCGNGVQGLACLSAASLTFVLLFVGSGFLSAPFLTPESAIIGAPITHAVFSPKLAALVAASAIVQSGLGHSGATTASNIFAGMTFALSLTLSTMVRPTKVLDFLGVTNTNRGWDPSLAFVMGGAVAVSLSMFQGLGLVGQGRTELQKFAARPISRSVIIGGILFGMGWAVAGLCPGPGVTVASAGSLFSAAFTLSMWGGRIVGGMIKPLLEESCKQP